MISLLAALLTAVSHGPMTVAYRFDAHLTGVVPSVRVELTVQSLSRGVMRFAVPSEWAGQDSLRRAIDSLVVIPPARLVADSGSVLVIDAPAGAVTIRYRLHQDWTGPIRWPLYHRPIIDSAHVILAAESALIYPQADDRTPLIATVDWRGLPADWPMTGSFGTSRSARQSITMIDLIRSGIVTGRFRVASVGAHRGELLILTERAWRFSDSTFGALQQRAWNGERAFWRDDPFAEGWVVLIPTGQRGSIGGTALRGGYLAIADSTASAASVIQVSAHELFHMWNGQRLPGGSPEERTKWFTEGFTDFYAQRFVHESDVVSDTAFAAVANRFLADYYLSPFVGLPLDSVARRFWPEPEMKTFAYRQGFAFAASLDGELRRSSRGRFTIDSLVLATYRMVRRSGLPFGDSILVAAAPASLREIVRSMIDRYLVRGEQIPDPQSFHGCGTVARREMYRFDLGFDVTASTRDRAVRGLVPGGPADLAGIREGAPLQGWGWYPGDATRLASLTVADSTPPRKVSYLPRGPATYEVPQIMLTEGCTTRGK